MKYMNKFKFIIIGGGTAGAIASSYIKAYWGDTVDVVVIYNHKNPNIGVGESLTQSIHSYLNYIGIDYRELIKYANSTIKLGIKFENWLNDKSHFYHPFVFNEAPSLNYNFEAASDLVNGHYDSDTCHGSIMFEENKIPHFSENDLSFSLHIDGNLFSKFILEKFKDKLTIIDDNVVNVIKKNNLEEIDYIICEKNGKIEGDFFIDSTGFNANVFSKLKNRWIDMQDWLPLNKFIPNPVTVNHNSLPVCTTAEATDEGWILQVPLQHRWGTGYLFSSNFISDENAMSKFDNFLYEKFKTNLTNSRILSFKSGFWEKQWVGNCLCIGLSSGFIEPLEATNIHHTIFQIRNFIDRFNFKIFNFDVDNYNKLSEDFYRRAYLFIRFCYTTGRKDSEFWKYMTNNTPYEIKCLEEKIEKDFLCFQSMSEGIFNYNNFFKIAAGLKKIDIDSYKEILVKRKVFDISKNNCEIIRKMKDSIYQRSIYHMEYIQSIHLNYN